MLPDSRFQIPDSPRASRAGFTLLETLVFIGIFSVAIVAFMGIFVSTSRVLVRQSGAAEVTSQSQFLLQNLQYYIERSSNVDMAAGTATTTLRLRMPDSAQDPAVFQLSGNAVTLTVAGGAASVLTTNKVRVADLSFTKRANARAHDAVAVAFTMEYNTDNLTRKFLQALHISVARVAAATFDSDLLPANGSLNLGSDELGWSSINSLINFSNNNVGIGIVPAAKLQVSGGDIYIDTATRGLILKGPSGANCYRITVTDGGAIATSSVAC